MSTPSPAEGGRPLRWWEGLDRYCWIVLAIAALGWLFDTMDQNLFNLVRRPSLNELLRRDIKDWGPDKFVLTPADARKPVDLVVRLQERTLAAEEAKPEAERPKSLPVSRYLREQLPLETRQLIDDYQGTVPPAAGQAPPSPELLKAVTDGLQGIMARGVPIYDEQRFAGVIKPPTRAFIEGNDLALHAVRGNRLLLEDAYPEIQRTLDKEVGKMAGLITAIFLIGWSVGGFIFGILGDRIGRTGTMILTILIYAIFTGLSGLVPNWELYAFTRFMTALGVGGEWAAGAAIVAETFPERSRAMALGSLQALSAVGNMMAAVITLLLGNLEANWRIAYFIGAIPALLVLWIRRSVREPEAWREAKEQATLGKELGNIGELFTHPVLRRNIIAATLMAAAGVGALWGVGFFSPDLLGRELTLVEPDPIKRGQMISIVFLLQQLGAFFGIYLFAVLAEKTSRRFSFFVGYTIAWIAIVGFFWAIQGSGEQAFVRGLFLAPVLGFCSLGVFAGYTVYFPELFPTRLRATGCGFGYNAARILAAFAPFALGNLAAWLGGLAQAATVVCFIYVLGFIGTAIAPETKGKPLPE